VQLEKSQVLTRIDDMGNLDENDRVTGAETDAALASYGAMFPQDEGDWMHPSLIATRQFRDALVESVKRGVPLSVDEIERRFGPIAWNW
jgi:hypothetical protein